MLPPPPPSSWQPAPLPPAPPPPPANSPANSGIELTTLRILREKGVISSAEYESALHDVTLSVGQRAPSSGTVVVGKWATTLYGFVEPDMIYDTTRSFNDQPGNSVVARAHTAAGDNSRFTFGARNSRLGLRLNAPEVGEVRSSAMIELDFGGLPVQPNYAPTGNVTPSEGSYFASPVLRIRHANFKIETPVVDILAGQYWRLFGWQGVYTPLTLQIGGVPGEVYSRTPQFRLSKTIKADPITFEIAAAAVRPSQRDAGLPDGEGGLRFSVDSWKTAQTVGATGTQISPFSIAGTGLLKRVRVDSLAPSTDNTTDLTMAAVAVDAFIPIIPATKDDRDNALSVSAEFSTGYGDADAFTGLTGGIGPVTLQPTAAGAARTATIDPGIVAYDGSGKLHGIQWTTYFFAAQYYVPGVDGRLAIAGAYSHQQSANSHYYGTAAATRAAQDFFDVVLLADPIKSTVRVGAEYLNFNDVYVDGQHAINHRVQLSGYYLF